MTTPQLDEPRSPGRTWWWVGGILVAVGIGLVVVGFVAPFLAFPFDSMANSDSPPDPEAISGAVGATFAGVAAVFGGLLAGAVGVVLVIVGFVRHANRPTPSTDPAPRSTGPAPTRLPPPPPPPPARRD